MITIDRKRNSQREHVRFAENSPAQDLPILEALLAENAQADARTQDCQQALEIQGGPNLWSLILPEEGHRSFIVMLGCVNVLH